MVYNIFIFRLSRELVSTFEFWTIGETIAKFKFSFLWLWFLWRLYKKYFRKSLQWFVTAFFIWGKSHYNDNFFFFGCQSFGVFDSIFIFVSFKVFYSIFDNVLFFPFFMILWVWVIILFLWFLVISFLFVFDGVEFDVDIVVNQWKRPNVWISTFFSIYGYNLGFSRLMFLVLLQTIVPFFLVWCRNYLIFT